MLPDFDNESLRALSGLILLIIAIVYIVSETNNGSIEYIMIGLASFLVGGAIFSSINKPKQ